MERKFFAITAVCLLLFFIPMHETRAEPLRIQGPWLWMIAPTEPGKGGAGSIHTDSLAIASNDQVTERTIATQGATPGDPIGDYQWTFGTIDVAPPGFLAMWFGEGNINKTLRQIGMAEGNLDDHSAYALITVVSDRWQVGEIKVSSDDAVKVWLNGQVVGSYAGNRPVNAIRFQNTWDIWLNEGVNLLMVKVSERAGKWDMYVGLDVPDPTTLKPMDRPTVLAPGEQRLQRVDRPIVKVIYFYPQDQAPRGNAAIDVMLKKVQTFFANQMGPGHHGFGQKTFALETDEATDALIIHQMQSQHDLATWMSFGSPQTVWRNVWNAANGEIPNRWGEIEPNVDFETAISTHVYLTIIDVQSACFTDLSDGCKSGEVRGVDGRVLVPLSAESFKWQVIAHELGHAFGLAHDFRDDRYLMAYPVTDIGLTNVDRISHCAAQWLDAHPAFNGWNIRAKDETTLQITTLPSSDNNFLYEGFVEDTDGIHQVQLLVPATANDRYPKGYKLHACTSPGDLGQHNNKITFSFDLSAVMTDQDLVCEDTIPVEFHVIDVWGDRTRSVALLPKPKDANLVKRADVDGDGDVDADDLRAVFLQLGQTGPNAADVDADGIVGVKDVLLVCFVIDDSGGAPALQAVRLEGATAAAARQVLVQARQGRLTDRIYVRGIAVLAQLLGPLPPEKTALLANYPNPFNPETWIPYHLSEPSGVTLTIYDIQGRVVRTLDLGHQRAGVYRARSRAAYWDGKNAQGESVASGVYFYTLTAGDFTATRKMLIRK